MLVNNISITQFLRALRDRMALGRCPSSPRAVSHSIAECPKKLCYFYYCYLHLKLFVYELVWVPLGMFTNWEFLSILKYFSLLFLRNERRQQQITMRTNKVYHQQPNFFSLVFLYFVYNCTQNLIDFVILN